MSQATARYAALLKEERLRGSRRQLSRYGPYEKQKDFHAAGRSFRERLLIAGNQLGKTYAGGAEVAMHATGEYPDWWEGKRFDKAPLIWTGSETNETSKEIIQKILLGTSEPNMELEEFGTGSIPGEKIIKVTTRQAGVKGVVDEILVKHPKGTSRFALKTYEQGRAKWQGASVDLVWFDEEPDSDIYSEGVTRTNATNGITFLTFTPLKGMSETVKRFLQPDPGDRPRHTTTMTIYDAGHYTETEREGIISSYPEHERDTRAYGVPMMGEGLVWPVADKDIVIDPIPIPTHWARIAGCDFGIDHPAAGAWLAHDRDTDTVYLYDCYKKSDQGVAYHAQAFKSRDPLDFIRVAWPHDGLKRDNKDPKAGSNIAKAYKDHGVYMMRNSARYDDESGGAQAVEPAVQDIYERMTTGRFKVFSTCQQFFEEKRMYHRKNGQIVAVGEDIISAARMAMMQLRSARTYVPARAKKATFTKPIAA